MSKAAGVVLIMVLCCSLFLSGCSKQGAQQGDISNEAQAKAAADGFKLSAVYGSALSEDELAIWQEAQGDNASAPTPLTVLASKADGGEIRLYLCRDMVKTGLDGWMITRIVTDDSGRVSACEEYPFDIWIHTYGEYDTPEIPENKGWKIAVPGDGSALIVRDMYGIFQIAAKHVEKEIRYVPVALLAEQLVAGTNYKYLCTDKAGRHLYILDIYEDMNSGADITGTGYVNLDDYL